MIPSLVTLGLLLYVGVGVTLRACETAALRHQALEQEPRP